VARIVLAEVATGFYLLKSKCHNGTSDYYSVENVPTVS